MVTPSLAPIYKIVVAGKDVTANIKPTLTSLRITDNQKDEADSLELVLGAKFQRPEYGDEIKVYLGWGDKLDFAGMFYVQAPSISNNKQLTIRATGINFNQNLKQRRTQAYETNLAKVVQTIAARHGLEVKTDMNVGVRFEQRNESDMAFLNRLAKAYNGIFNIKNGMVYMMAEGQNVPQVDINIDQCINSHIEYPNTTFYRSCKAIYHSTKLNKMVEVSVGSGEPVLIKQGQWLNDEQARLAATHALKRANQSTAKGTISIKGQLIFAGSKITLNDEVFAATQVTHTLSNQGWITDINIQQGQT